MSKQSLWTSILRDNLAILAMGDFVASKANQFAESVNDIVAAASAESVSDVQSIIDSYDGTEITLIAKDDGTTDYVSTKQLLIALVNGAETVVANSGAEMLVDDIAQQVGDSLTSWNIVGQALKTIAVDTNESISAKLSAFASKVTLSMGNVTDQAMALGSSVIQAFENTGNSAIDAANYVISLLGVGTVKDSSTVPSLIPDYGISDITGASAWTALGSKLKTGWDGIKQIGQNIWNGVKGFANAVFGNAWAKVKSTAKQLVTTQDAFSASAEGENRFSEFCSTVYTPLQSLDSDVAALCREHLSTQSYVHTQLPFADQYYYLVDNNGSVDLYVSTYLRPVSEKAAKRFFPGWDWRAANDSTSLYMFLPAVGTEPQVGQLMEAFSGLVKDESSWSFNNDAQMCTGLLYAWSLNVIFLYLLQLRDNLFDTATETIPINNQGTALVYATLSTFFCGSTTVVDISPGTNIDNAQLVQLLTRSTATPREWSPATAIGRAIYKNILYGMFSDDYSTDGFTPYAHENGVDAGRFAVMSDSKLADVASGAVIVAAIAITSVALKVTSMKVRKAARLKSSQQAATERSLTNDLLDPAKAKAAYKTVNKYRVQSNVLTKIASALGQPSGALLTNAASFITGKLSTVVSDSVKQVTNGGTVDGSSDSMSVNSSNQQVNTKLDNVEKLITGSVSSGNQQITTQLDNIKKLITG